MAAYVSSAPVELATLAQPLLDRATAAVAVLRQLGLDDAAIAALADQAIAGHRHRRRSRRGHAAGDAGRGRGREGRRRPAGDGVDLLPHGSGRPVDGERPRVRARRRGGGVQLRLPRRDHRQPLEVRAGSAQEVRWRRSAAPVSSARGIVRAERVGAEEAPHRFSRPARGASAATARHGRHASARAPRAAGPGRSGRASARRSPRSAGRESVGLAEAQGEVVGRPRTEAGHGGDRPHELVPRRRCRRGGSPPWPRRRRRRRWRRRGRR